MRDERFKSENDREPPRQPKRLPPRSSRKEGSFWIAIVLAVLVFAGCRSGNIQPVKPADTRQVTDDLGRTVTIPVKVTRVVSLAPSLTENIFAVGAGDRLVGVTTFCNYPELAKAIAKVGDTMNPNIETIVALKPDIVFVSTASQIEAFMKTLEQNGIAVYVANATRLRRCLSQPRAIRYFIWHGQSESQNYFGT